MPAQVLNGPAVATHMYQALFGKAPSNALYNSYIAQIGTTDGAAFAASLTTGFATTTDAALATMVLANLGVTATTMPATAAVAGVTAVPAVAATATTPAVAAVAGVTAVAAVTSAQAYAALESALTQMFTGYGVSARGQIILNMTNLLANLEGDKTFGTIATTYNNQTLSNFTYASNATNTVPAAVIAADPVTAGQTYTLTSSIDNFTGASGNDTFLGDNTSTGAADQINGGAGTDTLKLYGTVTKSVISNIENIYLNAPGGNFDASTITGVTALEVDAEAGSRTFTVTTGQAVTLSNLQTTAQTQTIAGNTPTSLALTVNKVGKLDGSVTQTVALTGTALTSLTLNAATADSAITLTNAGAKLATLTVTGDKAVTVTEALAALKTIDASAATGNVVIKAGGAANDLKFTGGAGADAVWFNVGEFTNLDTLAGGAGSDKVVIAETAALTATQYTALNGYTAFEKLGLNATGVSVDAAKLTNGMVGFDIESGNYTATVTNSLATTKYSVDNTAGNSGTLTITNKTGENSTTVAIDNQAGSSQTFATLVTTGIANVALASTGKANSINVLTTLTNSDNSAITVTGDRDLTITNALAATATGSKVDATAFTGKLNVTGSAMSDILIGGTAADTLNGGAVTHTVAAVTAVTSVAETQTVTVGGTATASAAVSFLGVATAALTAGDSAATVAAAIVTAKATIIAGATAIAAGINDISAAGAVLTITYKTGVAAGAGVGDVGNLASSATNNGATFTAGTEVVKGILGVTGVTAVTGSNDSLTGNAGGDTFAFSTADVATTAGNITATITDFATGVDKIKVTLGADAGAGSSTNFVKASATVTALSTLLTDADTALNGTVDYYVGQVGSDSYLVTDANGTGYTNVIKLTGVALAGIVATDLIA